MRLDHHIVAQLKEKSKGSISTIEISRAHIQRFIKHGGVKLNGQKSKKPHTVVHENDVLEYDEEKLLAQFTKAKLPKTVTIEPEWMLYDSPQFFAINKPSNVTSEACAGNLFLVHRLDKGTTGVLVIARSLAALNALQAQWKSRSVTKWYEALVFGHLSPKTGKIEGSLHRSATDRKRMVISDHPKARTASTEYEVLKYLEIESMSVSHVRFMPKTGRTHQIRVHSTALGHPIMGDAIYGEEDQNAKFHLSHQLLHASKLVLKDPETQKELVFEAPLPQDFTDLLAKAKA